MTIGQRWGGDILAKFKDKLKTYREARNFTVAELARASDVPRETIHRLESGERGPSWRVVQRLAKALGVRVDDFVEDRQPAELALVGAE